MSVEVACTAWKHVGVVLGTRQGFDCYNVALGPSK